MNTLFSSPPASPPVSPSSSPVPPQRAFQSPPNPPSISQQSDRLQPQQSLPDVKRPALDLDRQHRSIRRQDESLLQLDGSQNSNPLSYVKLARTKGARLLKAKETEKKTYLAVLCGDAGERVELFTGSRETSLSLNRTFVLPSAPISYVISLII